MGKCSQSQTTTERKCKEHREYFWSARTLRVIVAVWDEELQMYFHDRTEDVIWKDKDGCLAVDERVGKIITDALNEHFNKEQR